MIGLGSEVFEPMIIEDTLNCATRYFHIDFNAAHNVLMRGIFFVSCGDSWVYTDRSVPFRHSLVK